MTTGQKTATSSVYLNPDLKSPAAQEFEDKLTALIVGQDRAVRRITGLYQIYLAGLAHPGRPIGNAALPWSHRFRQDASRRGRRRSAFQRSEPGHQD